MLQNIFNEIYKKDEKRALIVKKFFEDMEINIQHISNQMAENGKYIIVIGNSTIRDVIVESWKIIEELANNLDFKTTYHFSYIIQNPYIRIPRNGRGGKVNKDYVLVLEKGN